MTTANYLTVSRIVFSPLFFVFFFLGDWLGTRSAAFLGVTWILFAAIEVSDALDGHLARRLGETSTFGKLFDPFADSFSRLTYFLCFTGTGFMPIWIFLLILYRDIGVSFIRQVASKRGVTMGARPSGKIKAWVYAVAGVAGMVLATLSHLRVGPSADAAVRSGALVIFYLCAAVALFSLSDYAYGLLRTFRSDSGGSRKS